jgi:hypothetical protein
MTDIFNNDGIVDAEDVGYGVAKFLTYYDTYEEFAQDHYRIWNSVQVKVRVGPRGGIQHIWVDVDEMGAPWLQDGAFIDHHREARLVSQDGPTRGGETFPVSPSGDDPDEAPRSDPHALKFTATEEGFATEHDLWTPNHQAAIFIDGDGNLGSQWVGLYSLTGTVRTVDLTPEEEDPLAGTTPGLEHFPARPHICDGCYYSGASDAFEDFIHCTECQENTGPEDPVPAGYKDRRDVALEAAQEYVDAVAKNSPYNVPVDPNLGPLDEEGLELERRCAEEAPASTLPTNQTWVVGQETIKDPVTLAQLIFTEETDIVVETDVYFPFPEVAQVRVIVDVLGGDLVLWGTEETTDNLDHYFQMSADAYNYAGPSDCY